MTHDDDVLARLARAIDAGGSVDWPSTESSVADEPAREVIRELAVIAAVSHVHRSATAALSTPVRESLKTWGTFHLLDKVGEGAYGEVYRAWDARLDREVALKLLPAGTADQDSTSIIHEGRLLARIRHPNVLTIYGAEQIESRIGLWMEFVRGRTLEQILDDTGIMGEKEVIAIGGELCSAVSAVHTAGLLHRDIKAQNVMRSDDGRVGLMDFGAGRTVDDAQGLDLAGTPLYLAPEVLQGQPATARSDVYSLGVLLYHLLTGAYPVEARTVREVRSVHERGGRTAVRDRRPDVSARLARTIERAIDPRPAQRYGSVDELAADLTALTSRPIVTRLMMGACAAAAIILLVALAWETVAYLLASSRRPRVLLTSVMESYADQNRGRHQANPNAYDSYLRGRALVDRRGLANVRQAAEWFERAIAQDSAFAPAHAGLANAYAFMSFPFRGIEYETAYPVMRPAAVKAVQLDPMLAEAHVAMGWTYAYERDWTNADASFRRAIKLNPTLAQAYTSYSISTLQPLHRYEEALELLNGVAARDPRSLDILREIGEVQLFAGRYADAAATFAQVSEVEPDFPFVSLYLGKALVFAGRVSEGLAHLELGADSPWLASAYVKSGRRADAEKLAAVHQAYPYRLAIIAAALGDTPRTLDALERAVLREPHRIGRLLIEPELAAVRDHPRVVAIRRSFDLP